MTNLHTAVRTCSLMMPKMAFMSTLTKLDVGEMLVLDLAVVIIGGVVVVDDVKLASVIFLHFTKMDLSRVLLAAGMYTMCTRPHIRRLQTLLVELEYVTVY